MYSPININDDIDFSILKRIRRGLLIRTRTVTHSQGDRESGTYTVREREREMQMYGKSSYTSGLPLKYFIREPRH